MISLYTKNWTKGTLKAAEPIDFNVGGVVSPCFQLSRFFLPKPIHWMPLISSYGCDPSDLATSWDRQVLYPMIDCSLVIAYVLFSVSWSDGPKAMEAPRHLKPQSLQQWWQGGACHVRIGRVRKASFWFFQTDGSNLNKDLSISI